MQAGDEVKRKDVLGGGWWPTLAHRDVHLTTTRKSTVNEGNQDALLDS